MLLVGLALLAAGGFLLYEKGLLDAGFSLMDAKQAYDDLAVERDGLADGLEQSREQVAVLERTIQIERLAHEEIQKRLAGQGREIQELHQKVDFYEGILSPSGKAPGLGIQDLQLENTGQEGKYRFQLVLTQTLRNDKVASGNVSIWLEGTLNNVEKRLTIKDLAGPADLKFSFRYFQTLQGQLVVPDGFRPGRVVVQLTPHGKNNGQVERNFDWPVHTE